MLFIKMFEEIADDFCQNESYHSEVQDDKGVAECRKAPGAKRFTSWFRRLRQKCV